MKNQVIEVLDREHGKKVIEYWKSKGVDTKDLNGNLTKEDGNWARYYGVIDNQFWGYGIDHVQGKNAEIITLPEYPREMMVRDHNTQNWRLRKVILEYKGIYYAEAVDPECNYLISWRQATEIEEPEVLELTIDEIAKKFGVSAHLLKIKK